MADDCYGLGEATDDLGETNATQTTSVGRNVARGKSLLESDLSTVRKLQETEKTATGTERNAIKDEIRSHYADSSEGKMTTEKETLQRDLQADSDVKAYIGQLSHEEYANLHMELSDTYGGATARMAEKSFKAANIPPIVERLKEKGLYTKSMENTITNIKEETIIGPSGFSKLKTLDDLSKTGLDAIKTTDAKKTYNAMKSSLGEAQTNEIFALKRDEMLKGLTSEQDINAVKKQLDLTQSSDTQKRGLIEETQMWIDRVDDIKRIQEDDVYKTLSQTDITLDTNRKIDNTLEKIKTAKDKNTEADVLQQAANRGIEQYNNELSEANRLKTQHLYEILISAKNKEEKVKPSQVESALDQIKLIADEEKQTKQMSKKATELKKTILQNKLTDNIDDYTKRELSTIENSPNIGKLGVLNEIEEKVKTELKLTPMRNEVKQMKFYDKYKNKLNLKTEGDIQSSRETLNKMKMKSIEAETILNGDDAKRISTQTRAKLENGISNPDGMGEDVIENARQQMTNPTDDELMVLQAIRITEKELPMATENALIDAIEATRYGKEIDETILTKAERQSDAIEEFKKTEITKETLTGEFNKLSGKLGDRDGAAEILEKRTKDNNDPISTIIKNLNYDEYANLKGELAGVRNGETLKVVERTFKASKMNEIQSGLRDKELYTDSIDAALTTMKGEGILSASDFNKLRALDDLSKNGLDAIKTGEARKTYSSMKSKMGDEITNDIFAMKIEQNYGEITKKLDELSTTDKLFKKAPSKDELKVFEDISTGKRLPDGNSLEASYKMLDKLSSDAWSAINGSIKPLDELTSAQLGAVTTQMQKNGKWNKLVTVKNTALGTATIALAALYGIPQSLLWYGTSTPTNIAEMSGLYEQFKTGDEDMDSIMNKLLCPKCLDTMNTYLTNLDGMLNNLPFSLFLSIPIYGDYVRSYIETGITDNQESIRANYERMFGDLEKMGLVKKGDTALGYVPTTDEEKINYYKGNINALWDTGDEKWIKKYGEAIFGKGDAFSAAETPDQRPMSKVEAMLWYYSMEKQEKAAEYGSDMGVSDRTKGWDQKWSDFRDKVIAYGEAQDNAIGVGSTPEATGTSATESGKMSIEDAMAMAIQNTMKREGLSAEKATERTNDEIKQYMARGMSLGGALEKLTGTPVQGSGEGLGLSGGSGGSGGGSGGSSGSTKTSTSENKKAFALELAKKGLSNLTKDEKEIATKQLEFKEAKKANSGTTLNEFTSDMSASEKKETVKKYVADDYKGMSGSEIQEAARVDKAATAAAILDNCCGGGR